ncbi:MAG: TerB N-terminal domain-containing protein [Parabacteroides sp.]|nr:TerB N-terminal domain-containing protein [Parabacteroides sp.]
MVILTVIVLLTKGKSISNNESVNQSNNDKLNKSASIDVQPADLQSNNITNSYIEVDVLCHNGESDKEIDQQYIISQIVSGLLKNAIVRGGVSANSDESNIVEEHLHSNKTENVQIPLMEKAKIIENKTLQKRKWVENLKLREEANIMHQMGYLDEEINFIKNAIHRYELPDLAHKYWNLLLEKRMTEYAKLEIDRQYTISQIMYGLLQNAISRENINDEDDNEDYGEHFHSQKSAVERKLIDKEEVSKELTRVNHEINGIGSNAGMMDEVPYWKHMYVYSVADLQNANPEQEQFYYHFKASFFEGDFLDIKDNSNYAFVLMFDIADDYKRHKNSELLKRQLEALAENYPVIAGYINNTLSKTIIAGNQEEAERELQFYDKSRGQLCRWVKSNEVVEVQGIKLTRGNFYIGECYLLPNKIIEENRFYSGYESAYIYGSVVNPNLPANESETSKNIFCSYKGMSPAWRYEYLMWLSHQKDTSEVSVEILLFYLYGCEMRMFIDPQTNRSERRDILVDAIQLYKTLDVQSNKDKAGLIAQHLCDFIGSAIVKFFSAEVDKFDAKNVLKNSRVYQDFYIAQKITTHNKIISDDVFDIARAIYNFERLVPSQYASVAKQIFNNRFNELYKNKDLRFELSTRYQYIDYQHDYYCFYPERI